MDSLSHWIIHRADVWCPHTYWLNLFNSAWPSLRG